VVLADCLRHLGAHSKADRAAERLEQSAVNAGDLYNVACILSRWVPLAEKDSTLPEGKRRQVSADYATRAMAVLRKAVAAGYRDLESLKNDPDLEPLRRRDDFNQLLAELPTAKPPANPGP
jgi:hypothetical protein